jgi:hypothetical protein
MCAFAHGSCDGLDSTRLVLILRGHVDIRRTRLGFAIGMAQVAMVLLQQQLRRLSLRAASGQYRGDEGCHAPPLA